MDENEKVEFEWGEFGVQNEPSVGRFGVVEGLGGGVGWVGVFEVF
jgi:hypothetical protein